MRSPRLDQLSERTAAPSMPSAGDGLPGFVSGSVQPEYVPAPRSAMNASAPLSGEIASAERHENRRVVCGMGAMRSRGSKSEIGRATGDVDLEDEGSAERVSGKVEQGVGEARRKTGEALKDLGEKLNR